jgi:hypothetical protein
MRGMEETKGLEEGDSTREKGELRAALQKALAAMEAQVGAQRPSRRWWWW